MTRWNGLAILIVLALIAGNISQCDERRVLSNELAAADQHAKDADARSTVWQARYAEAAIAAERAADPVIKYRDRVLNHWDTLHVDSAGVDSSTFEAFREDASQLARACNVLLGAAQFLKTTCDSTIAAKDTQIAARDGVIVALRKAQPNFFERHWKAAAAIAFLTGTFVVRR